MKNLTSNEKELLEMIRTAEEPEKALEIAIESLIKYVSENSTSNKIIKLILERYETISDFAEAANIDKRLIIDFLNCKIEPTLDEINIIAKTLNKEPEEIAELFIEQQNK